MFKRKISFKKTAGLIPLLQTLLQSKFLLDTSRAINKAFKVHMVSRVFIILKFLLLSRRTDGYHIAQCISFQLTFFKFRPSKDSKFRLVDHSGLLINTSEIFVPKNVITQRGGDGRIMWEEVKLYMNPLSHHQ